MYKVTNTMQVMLTLFVLYAGGLAAQVQAGKESHHKNVFENKCIRLPAVWLNPGDTTLFHIHSTPSLFLHFTSTDVGSQITGQDWVWTHGCRTGGRAESNLL